MEDGLVTPKPDRHMATELGVFSFHTSPDMRLDGTLYGQGDVVFTPAGAMVIATPCSVQLNGYDSEVVLAFLVRDLVFVEQALGFPHSAQPQRNPTYINKLLCTTEMPKTNKRAKTQSCKHNPGG
jgi:hypothetical protein